MADLSTGENIIYDEQILSLLVSPGSSLSYTTTFNHDFRLVFVGAVFDNLISEDVTITFVSPSTKKYLLSEIKMTNEKNIKYEPQGILDFKKGTEINVAITNAGNSIDEPLNMLFIVELR